MLATRTKKKRGETGFLDPGVWIRSGQVLLAAEGVDSVRVEPLAKILNVTKGSFYWHFKDRNALLDAMLSDWRRRAVLGVIQRVERTELPPMERLRRLMEFPLSGESSPTGASIELAIRHWAKRNVSARAAVEEVDEHRLEYICSLVAPTAPEPDAQIRAHAFLVYSFMLAEAFVFGVSSVQVIDACEQILLNSISVGKPQGRVPARKVAAGTRPGSRRK